MSTRYYEQHLQDVDGKPKLSVTSGGNSIETWTHLKSNAFWLKDFLSLQISDARIMTFGYNAAAAFGQSTSDVIDHAKGLLSSLVDKEKNPRYIPAKACHIRWKN